MIVKDSPDFTDILSVKEQTNRLVNNQNDYSKEKLMLINEQDIERAVQEYLSEKDKWKE